MALPFAVWPPTPPTVPHGARAWCWGKFPKARIRWYCISVPLAPPPPPGARPLRTAPPPPLLRGRWAPERRKSPPRMSSGERPKGAAKGKQSDTEALCQPPLPTARAPGGQSVGREARARARAQLRGRREQGGGGGTLRGRCALRQPRAARNPTCTAEGVWGIIWGPFGGSTRTPARRGRRAHAAEAMGAPEVCLGILVGTRCSTQNKKIAARAPLHVRCVVAEC